MLVQRLLCSPTYSVTAEGTRPEDGSTNHHLGLDAPFSAITWPHTDHCQIRPVGETMGSGIGAPPLFHTVGCNNDYYRLFPDRADPGAGAYR